MDLVINLVSTDPVEIHRHLEQVRTRVLRSGLRYGKARVNGARVMVYAYRWAKVPAENASGWLDDMSRYLARPSDDR